MSNAARLTFPALSSLLLLWPESAHALLPHVAARLPASTLLPLYTAAYACLTMDRILASTLLNALAPYIHKSSSKGIATFIMASGRLRSTVDLSFIRKLAGSVNLAAVQLHDVKALCTSMVILDAADPKFIARASSRFAHDSIGLYPLQLTQFLWQAGRIPGVSQSHVEPLIERISRSLGSTSFSPRQLRTLASSLKTIIDGRYHYRPLFQSALKASLTDPSIRPWEVAGLVTSLVYARAYTPYSLASLAPLCSKFISQCSFGERSQIQWAYAAANESSPDLFAKLADLEIRSMPTQSAHAISVTAWAFARLAFFSPALFNAISDAANAEPGRFRNRELATIVWALSGFCLISDGDPSVPAALWDLAVKRQSMEPSVIDLLDTARLCLIHNGCVLDISHAEHIAVSRKTASPSFKRVFIRDQIVNHLKRLEVNEVQLDVRCSLSNLPIPLAVGKTAIEILLRPDYIDRDQHRVGGDAIFRHRILNECGWRTVIISEREILHCKEAFDWLDLLVTRLEL